MLIAELMTTRVSTKEPQSANRQPLAMFALLLLAAFTNCPEGVVTRTHTVLAVNSRGEVGFVNSSQIDQFASLHPVKHFPDLPGSLIGKNSMKAVSLQEFGVAGPPRLEPAEFFETTDVYRVWNVIPPRVSSDAPLLIAQVAKDPLGLSPEDRKRYDEHVRAGDRSLIIGYICAGLGILILIVGIALMIYRDRARKRKSLGG
jgi:hypothetical protein